MHNNSIPTTISERKTPVFLSDKERWLVMPFRLKVSHVPDTVYSGADGGNSTAAGPLRLAGGTVGQLHSDSWRPRRGHEAAGGLADERGPRGFGTCCTTRWHVFVSGFGTHLQLGTAHPTYTWRRRLGRLDGSIPLWEQPGECDRDEGSTKWPGFRTEAQDDPNSGPRRRWRIHCGERGVEGQRVPTVPIHGGRLAPRRRSNARAIKRTSAEDCCAGHSSLRGLRPLCPVWSSSSQGIEIQDLRFDCLRLCDEGVARALKLRAMEDLLPPPEERLDHAGRGGIESLSRITWIRDANGTLVEDVSNGMASHLLGRRSGSILSIKPHEIEGAHGHQGGQDGSRWFQPIPALGLDLFGVGEGRDVLAVSSALTSIGLDCSGESWTSQSAGRAVVVSSSLQGGITAIAPVMENEANTKGTPVNDRRKRRRGDGTKGGGAGEEPGQGKGNTGERKGGRKGKSTQKCFSWNHGNAPCGDLPPGQKYTAKVQRLHRCTKCDSPGHPSRTCPKKE